MVDRFSISLRASLMGSLLLNAVPVESIGAAEANQAPNPSLRGTFGWTLEGDCRYQPMESRKADGSGSLRLVTPFGAGGDYSRAMSAMIAVEPERQYIFGMYVKTENGPTYASSQVGFYDQDRRHIGNDMGIRAATAADGRWEEHAMHVKIPPGVRFVRLKIAKRENTRRAGIVWVDDIRFQEGLALEQPPAVKRAFEGAQVRVDEWGNFELQQQGKWTPFFPLCMYSHNQRDWQLYSDQGWNTVIWAGSPRAVRRARDAVSAFNPHGMYAGFQVAQYTLPEGWAFGDYADLASKLQDITAQGLSHRLLFFYWDNENHHEQWSIGEIVRLINKIDVDRLGRRHRPIYALQGDYAIARVHSARGLVDVSGTYFGGGSGAEDLYILDQLERQTSPAAFAQFNEVNGAGEMRMRLYNAVIAGAKAIGYWADRIEEDPVDQEAWWPDFPSLRREIDLLLPIIREQPTNAWRVEMKPRAVIRWTTREFKNETYIIAANQTSTGRTVRVRIKGLHNQLAEVRDFFTDKLVAATTTDFFSVNLPKIGLGTGTIVLRVIPHAVHQPGPDERFRQNQSRHTTGPLSHNRQYQSRASLVEQLAL